MRRRIKGIYGSMAALAAVILVCVIVGLAGCGKNNSSGEESKEDNKGTIGESESDIGKNEKESDMGENEKESGIGEDEKESGTGENGLKDDEGESNGESKSENEESSGAGQDENLTEAYKPVTLSFTGDIYFSDMLYKNYVKSGLNGFLGQSLVDRFKNADLMICDHEYAATNLSDEYKADYQLYTFKAPVEREKIWSELGVDIVTLANNHTLDYGEQGLLDTFEALKANGVAYIGAGKNLDEAISAEIRVINGKKIAVLAASRFVPNTGWYAGTNKVGLMTSYVGTDRFEMLKEEISRLKNEEGCDSVIVFVHFGTEKTNQINDNQPVIAHGYVDSGADAVIACHAHTLQGIEIYNNAPIFYNLGNFLFGSYSVDTAVANLTINSDNSISASVTPCKSAGYVTTEAEGDEAQRILKYIESISVNVNIDENGNVTEK